MYQLYYKTSELIIVKHEFILAILWVAAIFDLREMRIPNKLLLVGLIIRVLILPIEYGLLGRAVFSTWLREVIAFAFAFVVSVVCSLISKGSLGMGDIKLICLMALFLGTEGLLYAIFLSIFISFFAAIGLLIFKKKKRKDTIPFAPFILAGTFLSFILSGT